MTKRTLFGVFFLVVVYLFIFHLLPYLNNKNYGCQLKDEVYELKINAVVEKKFVDAQNHNNKEVIYSDAQKIQHTITFIGPFEEVYYYLNKGDSLIKKENTTTFRIVYKSTGKDTVLKYDVGCHDSK